MITAQATRVEWSWLSPSGRHRRYFRTEQRVRQWVGDFTGGKIQHRTVTSQKIDGTWQQTWTEWVDDTDEQKDDKS